MAPRTSKVTRKGQVTMPAEIRRKHRIEEGDTVVFEEREDHVALIHPEDIEARTAGALGEYARNGPVLEPHEMRDLAAAAIADEVIESMRQSERDRASD